MSKKTKSLLFNFFSFAIFFLTALLLVHKLTSLEGIMAKILAFVFGTVLAPKFQAITTKEGEKLFMSWIFIKGLREI